MFGGSLSPPGVGTLLYRTEEVCYTHTELRRDAFYTVALTCSALYLCLPLSLSVSCSLSPSSSLLPLLTLPKGFSCASAASYTPLHVVPDPAYRRSHGGVLSSV